MRGAALVTAVALLACLDTETQGLATEDSTQQTCVSPPCSPYVTTIPWPANSGFLPTSM
jgi:hypothetical protein